MRDLTRAQREAIAFVERRALACRPDARTRLHASLRAASIDESAYDDAVGRLRREGRVALAFHPERLSASGQTVARGLLADGVYRTQFETGVSSASISAFDGGARDDRERQLFGGAYHGAGVEAAERPRYGALFLVAHPDGPAPRFGSCYFVLRPEVSARCTFVGSQDDPAPGRMGTLAVLEPVMADLLRHVEEDPAPLGVGGLAVRDVVAALRQGVPCTAGLAGELPGRAIHSFVEAHVHGPVELARDVERLVVDSSFRGHPVADTLGEIASRYGVPLAWHPGFSLAAAEVPETFRDSPTRRLAERISPRGTIDAPAIGAAYNDLVLNPDAWRALGSPSEVRTFFRHLWHALVLYGAPAGPRAL
jgi:Protein of unknown function (DUF3626)